MSQVILGDLERATKILKLRLSTRLPIGVNIVNPISAEYPANINEHPGRFVGFFFKLDNGDPSFIWLSRNLPEPYGFSHVHVYYVNRRLKEVAGSEKKRFSAKKLAAHVIFCCINLLSAVPKFLDLSVLVQGLETTLMTGQLNLSRLQHIGVMLGNNITGFANARLPESGCDATEPLRNLPLWEPISKLKYKWIRLDTNNYSKGIKPDFDVMKIFLGRYSHCIYGIHYKSIETLLLLVSHRYIFPSREDFEEVKAIIIRVLRPYKLRFIGNIRYHGSSIERCKNDEMLRACLLALQYPMGLLKQCDVDGVITDEYIRNMANIANPESQFSLSQESAQFADPDYNCEGDDQVSRFIHFSQTGEGEMVSRSPANMSIASPEVSTQATEVLNTQEILSEVRQFKARRELRDDITEMLVPPVLDVVPYDDNKEDFLENRDLFHQCLQSYVNLWQAYCDVKILDSITQEDIGNFQFYDIDERFVVLPVENNDTVLVIIVDQVNNEWGYLNPYFGEPNPYTGLVERLADSVRGLFGVPWRPIALSSQFHSQYSKVHILMGLFYIGRLFKYAVRLPQKVFYQETHFRQFCWRLCYALQLSNAEFNITHDLVRPTGYLRRGAKRSMGSPVSYLPAVVSAKECPFCLRRGFSNMGSHMKMQHGKLATRAREARDKYAEDREARDRE